MLAFETSKNLDEMLAIVTKDSTYHKIDTDPNGKLLYLEARQKK